jgi:hypothetical protein
MRSWDSLVPIAGGKQSGDVFTQYICIFGPLKHICKYLIGFVDS